MLTVGALAARVAAVALANGVVQPTAGVSVAGAEGGAILGGALAGYSFHSYFRKYKEIKKETNELRCALDKLSLKHMIVQEDNEQAKQRIEKLNVVSE